MLLRLLLAFAILAISPSSGSIEGGLSGFGFAYDASSSCSKPSDRIARARLQDLPCDFRRENWCTIAGNAYPWHAVRRFVHENQGLMRRMYGDEKHISVLTNELEKNDVEFEFVDDQNNLFPEDRSSRFRQFQFDEGGRINSRRSRDFPSRPSDSRTWGKLDKSGERGDSKFQSHPNETPTVSSQASTTSRTTTSTRAESFTPSTSPSPVPSSPSSSSSSASSTSPSSSSSSTTNPTTRTRLTLQSSTTPEETSTIDDQSSSTPSTSTTTPVVTLEQIANVQNASINEIAGQIDRLDTDIDELTEIPEDLTDGGPLTIELDNVSLSDEDKVELDAEVSESVQQQQMFRPRPEYKPAEVKLETTSASSMEGQLFQDVANKEKKEPPVLKVRGINACPVKEEVVAPFWANNTRGEVLALLNLYPFEQYVHWEKCTDENKQMYCRDGCKCEQQYKLHRLLAYDPNNECRGIFSDWFKFPSCCICRCYDLPVEFRVTSRSPRTSLQRRKLKVRPPKSPPRQRFN